MPKSAKCHLYALWDFDLHLVQQDRKRVQHWLYKTYTAHSAVQLADSNVWWRAHSCMRFKFQKLANSLWRKCAGIWRKFADRKLAAYIFVTYKNYTVLNPIHGCGEKKTFLNMFVNNRRSAHSGTFLISLYYSLSNYIAVGKSSSGIQPAKPSSHAAWDSVSLLCFGPTLAQRCQRSPSW